MTGTKNARETQAEWIRRINEEANKPLTPWEAQFMESITDYFDRGGFLSDRQLEILERIYVEKTD